MRVVVVGAGPSGLFAADALLKRFDDVRVDVLDRLAAPFGLVRYGVAPDHPKIKSVATALGRTLADPRVRYFGNVEYGRDVSLSDLRANAHAVIFAVGASSDRPLGVPGEDFEGSWSATRFVAWYNGHPDAVDDVPPLDARTVVVVGMGNVAVDVARILCKSATELASTDVADHALKALAASKVRRVIMLGRRGPAQAKWTTKELRELGELDNADLIVHPADLALDPDSAAEIADDPAAKKNLEVLRSFAGRPSEGKPRTLELRFFASPIELQGADGRVDRVVVGRNELVTSAGGRRTAADTGDRESVPAGFVLRSVGYKGVQLPGLPFDEVRGVVPNVRGRVVGPDGQVVEGVYVAGWIKRGPSGVIGTNKADAMETVASLSEDGLAAPSVPGDDYLPDLLARRGRRWVDVSGWHRIDEVETRLGAASDRPRVKLTTYEDLLRAASSDAPGT